MPTRQMMSPATASRQGDDASRQPPRRQNHSTLLLGMSYACIQAHMKHFKYPYPDLLIHKETSVEQTVECVRRRILSEMDGRDLARCVATEQTCPGWTCCTVSLERPHFAAQNSETHFYRADRHVSANFNQTHRFIRSLWNTFCSESGSQTSVIPFSQVVLDYFYTPLGWSMERWEPSFFRQTLPALVELGLIAFPKPDFGTENDLEVGAIYLPFSAHCLSQLIEHIGKLKDVFQISFIPVDDLRRIALYRGTQTIDPKLMQHRLGKALNQEEIYCTIDKTDIRKRLSAKPELVLALLDRIEDSGKVRMIRLRPLRKHNPHFPREKKEQETKTKSKSRRGMEKKLFLVYDGEDANAAWGPREGGFLVREQTTTKRRGKRSPARPSNAKKAKRTKT